MHKSVETKSNNSQTYTLDDIDYKCIQEYYLSCQLSEFGSTRSQTPLHHHLALGKYVHKLTT